MTKYLVEVKQIEVYQIEVEADTEENAEHLAYDLFEKMDEKEKYSHHSDSEAETDILDEWE